MRARLPFIGPRAATIVRNGCNNSNNFQTHTGGHKSHQASCAPARVRPPRCRPIAMGADNDRRNRNGDDQVIAALINRIT